MTDHRRFNGTTRATNAWSDIEDLIIMRRYPEPSTSWKQLCELLPRRTKDAIAARGSKFGLTRRRTTKHSSLKFIGRLWELRERAGMTRAELAKKMGYHHQILGRWERGEARPSLQRLQDWCQALDAELVVAYRGTQIEPPDQIDDDRSTSK